MKTLLQLQTSLAYRMGEDSVPNDTNEKARRKSFINEGYRLVMSKHRWWFSEAYDSFNSVAAQESYGSADGVPTDIREIIELRYQNVLYTQLTQNQAMNAYTTPYTNYSQSYFWFNNKIYPVPAFSASVADGIKIKYYKKHTELSADADTIIIPDDFSDILVAYAEARVNKIDSERGTASDAFDEFNEILGIMKEENNKYLFSMKRSGPSSELVAAYE